MPLLIVINGPPGCGKSTLARMYAAEHALALILDVDQVRGCLGRWREDPRSAGSAARAIAVAAARAHLAAGNDVVVPQFLSRPGFLTALEHAARSEGAAFAEIVLLASKHDALRAYAARASSADPADQAAHSLAGHRGGEAELAAMHDEFVAFLATRHAARGSRSLPASPHAPTTPCSRPWPGDPAQSPPMTLGDSLPHRLAAIYDQSPITRAPSAKTPAMAASANPVARILVLNNIARYDLRRVLFVLACQCLMASQQGRPILPQTRIRHAQAVCKVHSGSICPGQPNASKGNCRWQAGWITVPLPPASARRHHEVLGTKPGPALPYGAPPRRCCVPDSEPSADRPVRHHSRRSEPCPGNEQRSSRTRTSSEA